MTGIRKQTGLDLPPDVRGVASGMHSKPFQIAGKSNDSGKGEAIPDVRPGRTYVLLAPHERKLSQILQFDRFVIDIREQYPLARWAP